ncbi:hypothetical protein AOLI_G00094150 [Acnodon oligacanthus]
MLRTLRSEPRNCDSVELRIARINPKKTWQNQLRTCAPSLWNYGGGGGCAAKNLNKKKCVKTRFYKCFKDGANYYMRFNMMSDHPLQL